MTGVELICLAIAIYYEARSEPLIGQLAVAQIIMQRSESPRFHNDVCDVTHQYRHFSYFWDGLPERPNDEGAWKMAQDIASMAAAGARIIDLIGVYHYVTIDTYPCVTHNWGCDMRVQKVIGNHKFLIDDYV